MTDQAAEKEPEDILKLEQVCYTANGILPNNSRVCLSMLGWWCSLGKMH